MDTHSFISSINKELLLQVRHFKELVNYGVPIEVPFDSRTFNEESEIRIALVTNSVCGICGKMLGINESFDLHVTNNRCFIIKINHKNDHVATLVQFSVDKNIAIPIFFGFEKQINAHEKIYELVKKYSSGLCGISYSESYRDKEEYCGRICTFTIKNNSLNLLNF